MAAGSFRDRVIATSTKSGEAAIAEPKRFKNPGYDAFGTRALSSLTKPEFWTKPPPP